MPAYRSTGWGSHVSASLLGRPAGRSGPGLPAHPEYAGVRAVLIRGDVSRERPADDHTVFVHQPIMATDPDGCLSVTPGPDPRPGRRPSPRRELPRRPGADPTPCLRCCLFCPRARRPSVVIGKLHTSRVLNNGPTQTGSQLLTEQMVWLWRPRPGPRTRVKDRSRGAGNQRRWFPAQATRRDGYASGCSAGRPRVESGRL